MLNAQIKLNYVMCSRYIIMKNILYKYQITFTKLYIGTPINTLYFKFKIILYVINVK